MKRKRKGRKSTQATSEVHLKVKTSEAFADYDLGFQGSAISGFRFQISVFSRVPQYAFGGPCFKSEAWVSNSQGGFRKDFGSRTWAGAGLEEQGDEPHRTAAPHAPRTMHVHPPALPVHAQTHHLKCVAPHPEIIPPDPEITAQVPEIIPRDPEINGTTPRFFFFGGGGAGRVIYVGAWARQKRAKAPCRNNMCRTRDKPPRFHDIVYGRGMFFSSFSSAFFFGCGCGLYMAQRRKVQAAAGHVCGNLVAIDTPGQRRTWSVRRRGHVVCTTHGSRNMVCTTHTSRTDMVCTLQCQTWFALRRSSAGNGR